MVYFFNLTRGNIWGINLIIFFQKINSQIITLFRDKFLDISSRYNKFFQRFTYIWVAIHNYNVI